MCPILPWDTPVESEGWFTMQIKKFSPKEYGNWVSKIELGRMKVGNKTTNVNLVRDKSAYYISVEKGKRKYFRLPVDEQGNINNRCLSNVGKYDSIASKRLNQAYPEGFKPEVVVKNIKETIGKIPFTLKSLCEKFSSYKFPDRAV